MRRYIPVIVLMLVALTAAACSRTSETNSTDQSTPPQNEQPGQSAPPATPEVKDPTYVADGKTPEDHVKEYFEAYKEGRYEDAFELQPGENKLSQPKADFVPLRESMPISDYEMSAVREEGNQAFIEVGYDLGQNGAWISAWTFEKEGDKWIAVRYKASMGTLN